MRIADNQRLILGPPGCGKTTRCLEIVEQELERVEPNRIAYVSFTRKAVEEAVARAGEKFGYTRKELPYFRTLHSLCYEILGIRRDDVMSEEHYKAFGEMIGYRFNIKKISMEDGLANGGDEGEKLLFVVNLARNRCVPLLEQWHELNQYDIDKYALTRVAQGLGAYKHFNSLYDYTDMLERIDRPAPVDVVIIDEAQDLSNLQWRTVKTLFGNAQRVYIAGDDDQSIYRWSGADVETFLQLQGEQEVLSQSYRLPASVHRVANRILENVHHRIQKRFSPRNEEGEVLWLPTIDSVSFDHAGSWLLLARNGYLLNDMEQRLRDEGLIYLNRYGESSVDHEHFAAIRIWEDLRKGRKVAGSELKSWLRPVLRIRREITSGWDHLDGEQQYGKEDLGLMTDAIWHEALGGIPVATREYYVSVMRRGQKLNEMPKIRLSTIHAAKGGEADNVVLKTDMSYKTFQGYQRTPDDEARVFYVGASRAKERLFVIDGQTQQNFAI